MAKNKTLEEQIKEHEDAIRKLRDDAAAAAVKLAEDKKSELQEALAAYNEAAKATGGRAHLLRLISDAERAGSSGKASGKRLRLQPDTRADITQKILKAAKAHKDGASKADIVKYLDTSGYQLGTNFNEIHLFAILNSLREGDEPAITTKGEKSAMRYFAA